MLVYAMVFTMVAAAIFYAAAAIWQARQNADSVGDYSQQRWLVDWEVKNSIRSAYQYSLDHGWGLPTVNEAGLSYTDSSGSGTNPLPAWWFYNINLDQYFYTNASGGNSGEAAFSPSVVASLDYYDAANNLAATLYPNGNLWTLTSANSAYANAHDSCVVGMPANNISLPVTHALYQLTPSDLFLIPCYRARDTNNNNTMSSGNGGHTYDNISAPAPFYGKEATFTFGGGFLGNMPPTVVFRSDLPFCAGYGAAGEIGAPTGPNGAYRWVREGIQYTLAPSAGVIPGGGTTDPIQNIANYIWSVEEPITNYQLLLLAPSNPWTLGGSPSYGTISLGSALDCLQFPNTGAQCINIPRILVWGNVANNFTGIAGSSGSLNCLAILAGQNPTTGNLLRNSQALSASGITWCLAKPSTRLSFGRGLPTAITAPLGNINPNQQASDLPTFLMSASSGSMSAHTTSGQPDKLDLSDERQLNIVNAQGLAQPPGGSTTTSSIANYVNPVLSISSQGVLQWSQQGNFNIMGSTQSLSYTTGGITGSDTWVSAATQGSNNLELDAPAGTHYRLYGLSGIHSYNHASTNLDTTEITIDLATFADTVDSFNGTGGNGASSNAANASVSGSSSPWQSPWLSPREIYIYGDNSQLVNTTQTLVVRIIGDTQQSHVSAGLLSPIKIVVDGKGVINNCDIRFIPDNSSITGTPPSDRQAVYNDRMAATTSGLQNTDTTHAAANYRRFILQTNIANSQISFESSNNGPSSNNGLHWYGVIIAPNGLQLGNTGVEIVNKGQENIAATTSPISVYWHGTILAGKQISMGVPSATAAVYATPVEPRVLNLTLMPDNGLGTTSDDPSYEGTCWDSQSCYQLFTPQYYTSGSPAPTQQTLMGRPMPILVPRLVWNFEDETSRATVNP
jgi:hypothetical protein